MDRPADLALEAEQRPASAPVVRAARGGAGRAGLFRKYLLLFIGLVAVALLLNAAVELAFAYRDSRALLARLQLEKADTARERIEQFIGDIQRQLEWTTTPQFAAQSADERRLQFLLLLRQTPAITGLSQLDAEGREQLKVSRIALDAVGSQADRSHDPAFIGALAHKVWFSPVYFREGSEPWLTLALAGSGRRPGVTVAEVNLKLIWDVITAMTIGQAGYAYVVDGQGRLIAHPDMSLVLRDTSFSTLPQVAEGLQALQGPQTPDADASVPAIARNFEGRWVLSAHAALPALGWLVFVELPMAEALAPLYASALHTGLVLLAGLALAALAAWFVVRRMTGPIALLEAGAARIGAGDLDARIEVHTGDELETLANQFNNMGAQLKQSYAGLERKVEERTAELAARNTAFAEQIDHQAATIDVLKAMSASPGDARPVFDLIVRRAQELCNASGARLFEFDGALIHHRTSYNAGSYTTPEAQEAFEKQFPMAPSRAYVPGRAILDGQIVHIRDVDAVPWLAEVARNLGHKSTVALPLMRGDAVIGVITLNAANPGGFSDSQIELLKTFAEQAVIAIGGVATFRELQTRTAELAARNSDFAERIDQQAATIDVLKVMSASPDDTQPVFDQISRRAQALCNSNAAAIYEYDGRLVHFRSLSLHPAATAEDIAASKAYVAQYPMEPSADTGVGRVILQRQLITMRISEEERLHALIYALGITSTVGLPLLRDGQPVGAFMLNTKNAGGFTDSQIELLKTFAEQAVIAIGSVATFRELQTRTAELTRSVAELQALEEVLRAVNSSLDLETVLATIIDRAVPLAQADEGMIYEFDAAEQVFVPKAAYGMTENRIARLRERRIRIGETYLGRSAAARAPIAVDDVQQDPSTPEAKELLRGIHAALAVPLLRDGSVVGGLVIRRRGEGAFAPATVSLMQTFAAQSVLAIENARLFQEAERARAAAEAALNDLRRAQDRLVQSEKMASLGQLTAGIAHEIKNPLNFVNNFSALSTELIDELQGVLANAAVDAPTRAEVVELGVMIKSNLEKVVQHGKRADGIVKNMLLHARESGGERRSADLNAVVEEALNLAYHGARAEKPGFNVTLERNFDPAVGALEIYPQEFTRVILNLCSNGFYAATRKAQEAGAGFEPTLTVTTEARADAVVIRVRDNGIGIPESARARLFEPFFTTKPAGEGTGLGLSLSHDIVVKQHGGSITVESEPGEFTEFTVTLPRSRA